MKLLVLSVLAGIRLFKLRRKQDECLHTCAHWFASAIVCRQSPVPALLVGLIMYNVPREQLPCWTREVARDWRFLAMAALGIFHYAIVLAVLCMEFLPLTPNNLPFAIRITFGLFVASLSGLYTVLLTENVLESLRACFFQLAFSILVDFPKAALAIPFISALW